jgi:hypothetical protein
MRPGGTARSLSRKREGVMDLQHGRLPLPLAGEGRGEGGVTTPVAPRAYV